MIRFNVNIYIMVGVLVCYAAILAYGSSTLSSNYYIKALCKNAKKQDQISITFDDGPSGLHTEKLLDILQKYDAKASFFVIGSKAKEQTELIKRMHSEGHTIGNHTFYHQHKFPILNTKAQITEIKSTRYVLERLGVKTKLFRPPFGVTNPRIARAIKRTRQVTIGWSIRSFDTKGGDKEKVLQRITSRIKGGDIILLHDNAKNSEWILEQVLIYLKGKNIKAVTVEELLDLND